MRFLGQEAIQQRMSLSRRRVYRECERVSLKMSSVCHGLTANYSNFLLENTREALGQTQAPTMYQLLQGFLILTSKGRQSSRIMLMRLDCEDQLPRFASRFQRSIFSARTSIENVGER